MPKKKPRSVSFTMHMDGQDTRAISVKLVESDERSSCRLSCRLADVDVFVDSGPLSNALFDLSKKVLKRDKKRDAEFHDEEESTMKMLAVGGTTISATQKADK